MNDTFDEQDEKLPLMPDYGPMATAYDNLGYLLVRRICGDAAAHTIPNDRSSEVEPWWLDAAAFKSKEAAPRSTGGVAAPRRDHEEASLDQEPRPPRPPRHRHLHARPERQGLEADPPHAPGEAPPPPPLSPARRPAPSPAPTPLATPPLLPSPPPLLPPPPSSPSPSQLLELHATKTSAMISPSPDEMRTKTNLEHMQFAKRWLRRRRRLLRL